jgi:hypothetical protein
MKKPGAKPGSISSDSLSFKRGSGFLGLDVEDLAAAIHAGLQIDVVGTAQFARILVFDIGGLCERVSRAAEAALHRRCLSFRNCHDDLHRGQGADGRGLEFKARPYTLGRPLARVWREMLRK